MKAVHKVVDVMRLGLHSLAVHKVRSFMSALGIIVGVWGVIASLAVSEGTAYQAQQLLRELGSDNIIVKSTKPAEQDERASARARVLAYGLTRRDVAQLRDNIPRVVRCAITHKADKTAHVGARKYSVPVIGTEPVLSDVARLELVSGRFLSHTDVVLAKPHCVLTAPLARKLFLLEEPMGQTVRLNGEPFVVVGVLKRLPQVLVEEGQSGEEYVLVPISADRKRFGEINITRTRGSDIREKIEVSQIVLQMADEKAVLDGAAVVRSLLERQHEKQDYRIIVPVELIERQKEQSRLFNIMSLLIASISLVVGGIGIMNILLASVTERTREIGIRRALGAKRGDIIVQFLIEAMTLTLSGGLAGVLIGWMLVPWGVQTLFQMKAIVPTMALVLPLLMAIVVGVISGLYPAIRAARLDPIVALRHE